MAGFAAEVKIALDDESKKIMLDLTEELVAKKLSSIRGELDEIVNASYKPVPWDKDTWSDNYPIGMAVSLEAITYETGTLMFYVRDEDVGGWNEKALIAVRSPEDMDSLIEGLIFYRQYVWGERAREQ